MTNIEFVALQIVNLRKKAGLSQEELADKLFVSRQAISKWERGEALPDTDNLISISKLFGVSLDELVGNTPTQTQNNSEEDIFAENKPEESDNDKKIKVDVTNTSVRIDVDDDFNVSVKDDEDDEDDNYYSYNNPSQNKKHTVLRLLYNLPYPIITTIAFLLWGFLADGWGVAWTLYITIPVYYSIIDCIRAKKLSRFVYPIFVAFIYCFLGAQWNLWHPLWVIFLTIPIFYPIANAIDKKSN